MDTNREQHHSEPPPRMRVAATPRAVEEAIGDAYANAVRTLAAESLSDRFMLLARQAFRHDEMERGFEYLVLARAGHEEFERGFAYYFEWGDFAEAMRAARCMIPFYDNERGAWIAYVAAEAERHGWTEDAAA